MSASAQPGAPLTRRDFEAKIALKAWKDPEFKKEILDDPAATYEKYLGQPLPEGVELFVHEEDANTLHITIPQAPDTVAELSDEDLEKVAGGGDFLAQTEKVLWTRIAGPVTTGDVVTLGGHRAYKAIEKETSSW